MPARNYRRALLPNGSAEHQTTGEESLASEKILLDSSVMERSKEISWRGREVVERRGDEKFEKAELRCQRKRS
jgi:hypothetical protein